MTAPRSLTQKWDTYSAKEPEHRTHDAINEMKYKRIELLNMFEQNNTRHSDLATVSTQSKFQLQPKSSAWLNATRIAVHQCTEPAKLNYKLYLHETGARPESIIVFKINLCRLQRTAAPQHNDCLV